MRVLVGGALALLVLLTGLVAAPTPLAAGAQAKAWRIERMDVGITVDGDGDAFVAETVTFGFQGEFSFVTRSIPVGEVEGIDHVVVSRDGREIPRGSAPGEYEVSEEGGRLLVRLHFALADTSATWTISYRVRGAVRFGESGDELRWHVFDAETPVPMDAVSVAVRLPGDLAPALLSIDADTGGRIPISSSLAPSTMTVEVVDVPPRTRLWLRAGFPTGVVEYRWTLRRAAAFVAPKAGLALPLLTVAAVAFVVGRRRGGRRLEPPATYLTEPPRDLPPALAGALLDGRAGRDELVATVADLARRGYLEIGRRGRKGAGPTATSVTVHRVRPLDDLDGVDRAVARGLYLRKRKDTLEAEELRRRFTRMGQEFEEAVYAGLVALGYFHGSPGARRRRWRRTAGGIALLVAAAVVALVYTDVGGWGFLAIGGGLSSAIVFLAAPLAVRLTAEGLEARVRWAAFRDYLVELTRFPDVSRAQEIFEGYLPYAVAFGVAEDWGRRFDDMEVTAPVWYLPWHPDDERGVEAAVGSESDSTAGARAGSGVTLAAASAGLFAGLAALSDAALAGPGSGESIRGVWAGLNSDDGTGDSWGGGDFGGGGDGGGGGGGFDAG